MNWVQTWKMAFASIFSNKMRSFLTMLGIIIGVLAVTLLVSVVQGATGQVTSQIASMGSNLLTVSVTDTRANLYLTIDDLAALQGKDGVALTAPLVTTSAEVAGDGESQSATVQGVTPNYFTITDLNVQTGRLLGQTDIDNRTHVALIGVDLAEELFDAGNVVGQAITIADRTFTIVGLLEEQGSSLTGSQDERVLIPFTTAQRMTQNTQMTAFYASAESSDTVAQAESTLNRFMYAALGDEDAYTIYNQSALLDAMDEVLGTMSLLLGGIAGISLLVGGIGIMNIMLVSVTERTREIGIRKAIGAQRWDILVQFLIEAIVLSLLGGLIGLALGMAGAALLTTYMGMTIQVSLGVAAIAIGFSVLVGVVFGVYPAAKASRLHPIEALRYE